MAPDSLLNLDYLPGTFGLARFVRAEGTLYLVITANYRGMLMPGDTAAGVLLLHPDGRVLDWVQMSSSTRQAFLDARILEKTGSDGAQMVVIPASGFFLNFLESTISCRLDQWRREPRELVVPAAGSPEADGVCRMRIRGDQIQILTPQK